VSFSTETVTYTALGNDPLLGQALGINIFADGTSPGGQFDFDRVRLTTATVVPLPLAMLGTALVSLFAARRGRHPSTH